MGISSGKTQASGGSEADSGCALPRLNCCSNRMYVVFSHFFSMPGRKSSSSRGKSMNRM